MNYRSVAHLNEDVRLWSKKLPDDIDLIVGIPRSGMLVANLLALHRNVSLADVEKFRNGSVLQSGLRHVQDLDSREYDKILVVDDTVNTGKTINSIRNTIDRENLSQDLIYGAVYVSHQGKAEVDTFASVLPTPRVFEWNIFHHPELHSWCLDLDGVLCRDPTPEENDDGENYREFISSVNPKVIPSKQIGSIVTSRLEKYRTETEEWLGKHNIEYKNLHMMDYPSKKVRQSKGNYAEYKSNMYNQLDAQLFVESNKNQAELIVQLTNKPVFCTGVNQMFRPGYVSRVSDRAEESMQEIRSFPIKYAQEFADDPIDFAKRAFRYVFYT